MTMTALTAGVAGLSRHGCIALAEGRQLLAVCEQQSVTRVKAASCNPSGLPDEALDTVLERLGRTRSDVTRYASAEAGCTVIDGKMVEHFDHHLAHACTSYLSSPFPSATIVVCDQETPKVSVWRGRAGNVERMEWPWRGQGFTDLYSACAAVLGFVPGTGEQRMESLARLRPEHRDEGISRLFAGDGTSLMTAPGWEVRVEERVAGTGTTIEARAGVAAALQGRVSELLVEFLGMLRRHTSDEPLCLSGTLFYHSSLNTAVKQSHLFSEVFVPLDPGDPGLAVGTALHANRCGPGSVSPFLGPQYAAAEIKATLDNCKLRYDWLGEAAVIEAAVVALTKGTLVGWYEGPMEWGPRALGARSILANPLSPYVLENLNGFLKRRDPWRGYSLSALEGFVDEQFEGPAQSPFMECDYTPRDASRFRHVLPAPKARIRVHRVGRQSPSRFKRLLQAFGEASGGVPCLVNTSFNGFHEPIVCTPRDAVRVFYGSGIDMLVLDQFILAK